jgi:hypothetical protein
LSEALDNPVRAKSSCIFGCRLRPIAGTTYCSYGYCARLVRTDTVVEYPVTSEGILVRAF